MKKTYQVKKSSVYSSVDYSCAIRDCSYLGFKLTKTELEPIPVTSGAVAFFDPYSTDIRQPFCESFPIGDAVPFALGVATSQGDRIALAGLRFLPTEAVSWRRALYAEKDVVRLERYPEVCATTIDSGLCAFCDYLTEREYVAHVKNFNREFHPLDAHVGLDGNTRVRLADGCGGAAIFSAGWGEGIYTCYIGEDAEKRPCALVCDFMMIDHPKKKDDGAMLTYEFDVSAEENYEYDPRLSEAENHIAKWSKVIESGDSAGLPELFNAYSRRGYAYHSVWRTDEALSDYMKAINIGIELEKKTGGKFHTWTLFDNAGSILRGSGRTDEAIELFMQAKSFGDTFYAGTYTNLIEIYAESRNYAEAIKIADEMIAARPSDPVAYSKRAELLMLVEDYEKAIADLDMLIYTFKMNEPIFDKATCLSNSGRSDEALAVIDCYLIDAKANETFYYNRAVLHYRSGNITEAYADLLKALDCNSVFLPVLEMLIELDAMAFNYKNLIKWATRYIDVRPMAEYGYAVRGETHYKMGNNDYALEDCRFIIAHINDGPVYLRNMIRVLIAMKDSSRIKKFLRKLRRSDTAYYVNANGLVLMSKGKLSRAERYLATAFHLNENESFLCDMFDCFLAEGKTENAQNCLKRMKEINPDGEDVLMRQARLAKAMGNAALVEKLKQDYINKFMKGMTDPVVLDRVDAFFRNS